jgi:hypothetical protein
VISYFISVSIRLHYLPLPPPGVYCHLQGLEKIILFPLKCDGQVLQGVKIHFPDVLTLWIMLQPLKKQISPFTDFLEG